jgi:hypothetical protein
MNTFSSDRRPHKVQIIFPADGRIRSRKVVTRSRARATGKFPSLKMNRMLQWESVNELNAFRLLEVNPAVLKFNEQPCELHYVMNDEPHVHYPDILVHLNHGAEFWEIKAVAEAKHPDVIERTKLLTQALPNFGYQYRVILGEDLGRKVRLENIKSILAYGRKDVTSLLREKVRQIFCQHQEIKLGELIEVSKGKIGRNEIYRLILIGDLICDLEEQQLTSLSILRHVDGDNFHREGELL